ncbi:MAG TPA: hypothetical protein VFI25_13165 [Planctomycetota bacterium]|jgi:hypothetical protein|nr:hypothetical protein [Planctomycetota bacterium]
MGRPRKRAKKDVAPPTRATTLLLDQEAETSEAEDQSEEVLEFIRAIDEYRRMKGRPFPTWTEVLGILRSLGYRKVPAEA